MLQVVERQCGTIKESVWELHDKEVVCRISMSQGWCPCIGGHAAVRVGWEVTLGVIFHDKMFNLSQQGVATGN